MAPVPPELQQHQLQPKENSGDDNAPSQPNGQLRHDAADVHDSATLSSAAAPVKDVAPQLPELNQLPLAPENISAQQPEPTLTSHVLAASSESVEKAALVETSHPHPASSSEQPQDPVTVPSANIVQPIVNTESSTENHDSIPLSESAPGLSHSLYYNAVNSSVPGPEQVPPVPIPSIDPTPVVAEATTGIVEAADSHVSPGPKGELQSVDGVELATTSELQDPVTLATSLEPTPAEIKADSLENTSQGEPSTIDGHSGTDEAAAATTSAPQQESNVQAPQATPAATIEQLLPSPGTSGNSLTDNAKGKSATTPVIPETGDDQSWGPPLSQPPAPLTAEFIAQLNRPRRHGNDDNRSLYSFSDTDSAIGDVSAATSVTSMTSSIYEAVTENGRSYHAYKPGKYMLPNDPAEQSRLDAQHLLLCEANNGHLFRAPLEEHKVNRVLDIATGTGIWAMEFADDFPQAEVIGTDLAPIQPRWCPPNCHFEIDDAEDEFVYASPFSYIHARAVLTCFKDPNDVIRKCVDNLEPGGWLEFQDATIPFEYDGLNAPSPVTPFDGRQETCLLQQWEKLALEASIAGGRPWNNVVHYTRWFAEAGLVDVREYRAKMPFGTWNGLSKQERRMGTMHFPNMYHGLEGMTLRNLARIGWSFEDSRALVERVRAEMLSRRYRCYNWSVVVIGRKPEVGEEVPPPPPPPPAATPSTATGTTGAATETAPSSMSAPVSEPVPAPEPALASEPSSVSEPAPAAAAILKELEPAPSSVPEPTSVPAQTSVPAATSAERPATMTTALAADEEETAPTSVLASEST